MQEFWGLLRYIYSPVQNDRCIATLFRFSLHPNVHGSTVVQVRAMGTTALAAIWIYVMGIAVGIPVCQICISNVLYSGCNTTG